MTTEINQILKERSEKYGSFEEVSATSEAMQIAYIRGSEKSEYITYCYQSEALRMIFNKIARISCGDPNHVDSWRDIAGYALLVVNILENENITNK